MLAANWRETKKYIGAKNTQTRETVQGRLPPIGRNGSSASARDGPERNLGKPLPPITGGSIDSPPAYNEIINRQNKDADKKRNDTTTRQHLFATAASTSTSSSAAIEHPSSVSGALPISNEENENEVNRIKDNGIRTYPVLAVVTTFLCCPLLGFISAILTLNAENSFYEGDYLRAHRVALASRVCVLLALIFGVLFYIGLIIMIIVLRT